MSLEKTKKQLVDLLYKSDNNVIALSGKWGTGKTHLWNEVQSTSRDAQVQAALYVSLFGLSSVDQIKRKLMEIAIPRAEELGGTFDVVKNFIKVGVKAASEHYKALAALNDLNVLLMAPIVLREKLIVIDDIERKHDRLGIDEVLGFIDEYSKQFKVRFVLVLNDDQLSSQAEQERLWTTFREKVIDQEIKLLTTPQEAFAIAVKRWPSKYEEAIKEAVATCCLTNIRIVGKVIKVTNQILAGRDLNGSIQARVVPSIVLFSAIHYRGLEHGPDFQFALEIAKADWEFARDKNIKPTAQVEREDGWRMLMHELGIYACDDFERILVEFLESGLFEGDEVQAIIDRYVHEAQKIQAGEKAREFIRKAFWDHHTTEADLIAQGEEFPQIAGELDPFLVTELHAILCDLAGGQALADQLIRSWLDAFHAQGTQAPSEGNPFGNPLHPSIQSAWDASSESVQAQTTVADACNYIIEHNGWGTLQEIAMKRATAADFESAIRRMDVGALPQFMRRMIQMRLQRSTYDAHFGNATERFVEACRAIATDRAAESARLAKLIKRLFASTSLAEELSRAAPPTHSAPDAVSDPLAATQAHNAARVSA